MGIINIDFDEKEIGHLWHTGCKSFLSEQKERFEPIHKCDFEFLEASEKAEYKTSLRWCNSFLEAKILSAYIDAIHKPSLNSYILWDLDK